MDILFGVLFILGLLALAAWVHDDRFIAPDRKLPSDIVIREDLPRR